MGRETDVVRTPCPSSQLKVEASGTQKGRGLDHGLFPSSETDFSPPSLHISGLPLMDIIRKSPIFRKLDAVESSRLAPHQPHLPLCTPLSLLFPLIEAGPSNLLLRNRRFQKQWECYLCKKPTCQYTPLPPHSPRL